MKKIIWLLGLVGIFSQSSYAAWESETILRVKSNDPDKITAALFWSPDFRDFFYSKELSRTSKVIVTSVDVSRVAYRFKNDENCSVANPADYVIYTSEGMADFNLQADPEHTQSRLIVGTTPIDPCFKGVPRSTSTFREVKLSK